MRPELSIVIPTFRRPVQLAQALRSVLTQGGLSVEVIVVDDSPEGSAKQTIDSFSDPRIQYLKNPTPSGGVPSKVRNLGLERCRGVLVHFLDDDDIVPEGHYDLVREELLGNPGASLLFGCIEPFGEAPPDQLAQERMFFDKAAEISRICSRLGNKWPFVGQMLFGQVLLVCSAAIVRREEALQVGGFDPDIVLHEDRDFFVRVMRKYGAKFMDRVSLRYRIGSPSLMHASKVEPEQSWLEREGARLLRKKYLALHGSAEYLGLKFATRALNLASGYG